MSRFLLLCLLGVTLPDVLHAAELDPANCAKAAAYSRQHGGEALRIEQAGHLVYEDYAPGFSANEPHKIYSGTKSYIAVTALLLEQQGKLRFDEPASATLTEWKNDARRSITIEQLLSQTSGLDPDGDPIYAQRDQLAAALHMRLIDPPGVRFHYGAVNYQAFGEILRRKFGQGGKSVEDIVVETLLDPYDLPVSNWKRDDAGNVMIHTGMALTTKEWARFGRLLLRSDFQAKDGILFRGHQANPAYGLGFWLNAPPPANSPQKLVDLQPAIDGDQLYPGGPRELFAAIGAGKQRLYVIPSQQLIVVRFGHETAFSDGDFLSRLLTGRPHPDARTH